MLATIQCFSISDESGGARILRALFNEPVLPSLSICTVDKKPFFTPTVEEVCLPLRPSLGRIERTRFANLPQYLDELYLPKFKVRLSRLCRERNVATIHTITHGAAMGAVRIVAREIGAKLLVSFHDDIGYMMRGHPKVSKLVQAEKQLWLDADKRFVICEELGNEFSKRYGRRNFETLTDGLERIRTHRKPPPENVIYFMGTLHQAYLANFESLCQAISQLNTSGSAKWKLVIRSSFRNFPFPTEPGSVEFLPFGSEAEVQVDMDHASIVYLPLPFGAEHEDFVRLSLSTKMVSYLGAGLPILYHGPGYSAAANILIKNGAAAIADSLDSGAIIRALRHSSEARINLVAKASELAARQFLLEDQRRRFWASAAPNVPGFAPS